MENEQSSDNFECNDNAQIDCGNSVPEAATECSDSYFKLPSSIDETFNYGNSSRYSSGDTGTTSLSCEYDNYCGSYSLNSNLWSNERISEDQRHQVDQNLNPSSSHTKWFSSDSRSGDQFDSNREGSENNEEMSTTTSHISPLPTLPLSPTFTAFDSDSQLLRINDVSQRSSLREVCLPCTSPSSQYSTTDEKHVHTPLIGPSYCVKETDDNFSTSSMMVHTGDEDPTSFTFLNCFLNRLGSPSRSLPQPALQQNEDRYRTEERSKPPPESRITSQVLESPRPLPSAETGETRPSPFPTLNDQKDIEPSHSSSSRGGSDDPVVLSELKGRENCNSPSSPDLSEHRAIATPVASSSKSLKDSLFHSSPPSFKRTLVPASSGRCKNWFDVAHQDSFGISPPRSESLQDIASERYSPPDSSDDEDDSLGSDTVSSYSSMDSTREQTILDSTSWSFEETLNAICKPNLIPFEEPKSENLHTFLNPHDVGHINYLVKCYSDAVFSISVPSSFIGAGKTLSPITYLNLHMLGVFQVYYLMFKCEDYRNLTCDDQVCLLEGNMIPILISLGFIFFDVDTKSWTIPFVMSNTSSSLPLCSLLQIIPERTVHHLTILHDVARDLKIDETMSLLFVFIIVYTPVGKPVKELHIIDRVRDKYVNILLQYLRWKFGPNNGAMLFPEMLKILDALLKFSEEINDYNLRLSNDEIALLKYHFKFIEEQTGSVVSQDDSAETEDVLHDKISYSSFHAKLSSIFLRLGTG